MKILYIGDIMGRPGRQAVKQILPNLINERQIDFVIAQGENLSGGKGMRIEAVREMQQAGVNVFTGGNHTWFLPEIYPYLDDPKENLIRPANYPPESPGRGFALVSTPFGKVLVISVLGNIVPKSPEVDHPLKTIDRIITENQSAKPAAIIVDFHGDYSSEKVVVGHYLDGRVTAVVGDHWHVPTADAQVLPGGTAHITDVGMVGPRYSSLGVKTEVIIARWLSQMPSRNELASGPSQFCAVIIDVNPSTGLANGIEQVIRNLP
jgi:2',3'-cyclic-nucleotide 2'-phosphodiesterase